MTTFTLIVSIIIILFLLIVSYAISFFIHRLFVKKKEDEYNTQLNVLTIFLILIVIALVLFSLTAPFLFTRMGMSPDFDFTETGQIGDTVGGLMSPFINFSAVIVTGLAFYMQYRANKLQIRIFRDQLTETQRQFKDEQDKQDINSQKQQFESQFYEMLRLHKENVNEIEIDAKKRYVNKKTPPIRSMGASFLEEPSEEAKKFMPDPDGFYTYQEYRVSKRNAFVEMLNELEYMIKLLDLSTTPTLDYHTFQEIYEIYFWGLPEPQFLADKLGDPRSLIYADILYNIQQVQYSEDIFIVNKDLPFNIPAFRGHSNFLGHYYRHLFHTVKFVANYDEAIIDKIQKKNYLRLLRAQLSNHEQALLFYNWLAKYGGAWQDDENDFFTEFKMIHNVWYRQFPKKTFIMNKLKELVSRYKALGYKDNLFEMKDKDIIDA